MLRAATRLDSSSRLARSPSSSISPVMPASSFSSEELQPASTRYRADRRPDELANDLSRKTRLCDQPLFVR